ncbi:MAG: hypothetical protein ACM358_17160 [Gemmatimonadota bacterium]
MRNPVVLASFVLLSGNTANCNLSGPVNPPTADFTHAVSTFLCGPADGPATAVLLARDPIDGLQPSNPYVSVVIQRPASGLAGTTWVVRTNLGNVSAVYVTGSGQQEEATSGTVRITRVVAQERVEGSVDLRFPSRNVTTAFSAPWIESFILCG